MVQGVFAGRPLTVGYRGVLWGMAMLMGFLLGAEQASAAGINVTIDRAAATVDDQLLLSVTVDGSQSAEPSLPDLRDFDVQGRGKSTQMQFVNGRLSTAATYSFVLTPKHQGTITIGSATVEIDGQPYKSEPFSVSISSASRPCRRVRAMHPCSSRERCRHRRPMWASSWCIRGVFIAVRCG